MYPVCHEDGEKVLKADWGELNTSEIEEGRMFVSISCTTSFNLFVLFNFSLKTATISHYFSKSTLFYPHYSWKKLL